MKIRTSRGNEIEASFVFAPTIGGNMVVKIRDDGAAISEICATFENVDRFECREETAGAPVTVYEGYTKLMRASRESGTIMVTLRREE